MTLGFLSDFKRNLGSDIRKGQERTFGKKVGKSIYEKEKSPRKKSRVKYVEVKRRETIESRRERVNNSLGLGFSRSILR